jgi:hypothetical protein
MQLGTLRLLKAFDKIQDPVLRRIIVALVEKSEEGLQKGKYPQLLS